MTTVIACAPSGMKGGCTSCTTVSAFSQSASYFFDIGRSPSVGVIGWWSGDALLGLGVIASVACDVGQFDAQPLPATGHPRHHGAMRNVHHHRGFGVGVSLHVGVVHGGPESLRKGV